MTKFQFLNLLVLILIIAQPAYAKFEKDKTSNLTWPDSTESPDPNDFSKNSSDSVVMMVEDPQNIGFIFKQIKNQDVDEQFLLISDFIASNFGFENGIKINEVQIIAYNQYCMFKFFKDRAATLHTFIDGKSLEDKLPDFLSEHFTVQQRVYNPDCEWQKKWPITLDQQGLTKEIIESMATHCDLPAIVAFDTLIGNADRSRPNIIYNPNDKHFYAIDQAAAFTKELPKLAIEQIEKLKSEKYFETCSEKVIDGLKIYCETLEKLTQDGNLEKLIGQLQNNWNYICVEKVEAIADRIHFHCRILRKNFSDCKNLIKLLREICTANY